MNRYDLFFFIAAPVVDLLPLAINSEIVNESSDSLPVPGLCSVLKCFFNFLDFDDFLTADILQDS